MQNKFISFEGGEGAGKSTQVKLLAEFLREKCAEVVTTREPGGTKGAEEIRALLLTTETKYDPFSEVLLNFAARRDHLEKLIKPALARGAWVLCDRFFDSTTAYQGYGQGVDLAVINSARVLSIGNFAPWRTFVLDIEPEQALKRAAARGDENRFEKMGLEFHKKIRAAFLDIAKQNPERCKVIDASKDAETLHNEIKLLLEDNY